MLPITRNPVVPFNALAGIALALVGGAAVAPSAWGASVTVDIPACSALTASASGSTVTLNCTPTAPPPAGAPNCTAKATPSSGVPVGGGTVALEVSCDVPLAAGTKMWKWPGGAEIPTNQDTYKATANVGANTASAARDLVFTFNGACAQADPTKCSTPVAYSKQDGTAPPPPVGIPDSCTINGTRYTVVKFTADGTMAFDGATTHSVFFNGATQMAIGSFTTRSAVGEGTGKIPPADLDSTPPFRKIVLSETPCDFGKTAPWASGPALYPTIRFTVGGTSTYYANLKPNTTYYLHMLYQTNAGPSCTSGTCGTSVVLYPPPGH